MNVELITKQDLHEFRQQLIQELKDILQAKVPQQKQWLRSSEVRKLLSISPGTLQTLRVNGTLAYSKIGGTMYYDYAQIQKLMENTNS